MRAQLIRHQLSMGREFFQGPTALHTMFTVGVGAVVVWTGWGVDVISGVVDFVVVVGFAVVVVVVVTTFSAVVELVTVELANIVVVLDSDVTDVSGEGRVDVITVVLFPWIRISEHA